MKYRRHTPDRVVRKLREADRTLGEGADLDAVCRHLEVSQPTYQALDIAALKDVAAGKF